MKRGVYVNFKGYLIDLDGVLRLTKGCAAIPGACEWIKQLVSRKIPFLIATNHTTSSPQEAAEELQAIGFPIDTRHMHTPLTVLFEQFKQIPPGRVYARGTPPLLMFLKQSGLNLTTSAHADTVLLGFDRTMNYEVLCTTLTALIEHKARFIALHENHIYRNADGGIEPGLGAWVRALEYSSGQTAVIIGKPSEHYYKEALKRLGTDPEKTVMISDDPMGDLVGAKKMGITTIFVTSGKHPGRDILDKLPTEFQPDRIYPSIADIPLEP